jgi:hypothetical protein
MPTGLKSHKGPADVVGAAVMVGKVATGEITQTPEPVKNAAAELGRRSGQAWAEQLSTTKRRQQRRLVLPYGLC